MKKFIRRVYLILGGCMLFMLCGAPDCNGKTAQKAYQAVSKGSKSTAKGAKELALCTDDAARAAIKITAENCSHCNGTGKYKYYDSNYEMWRTRNCAFCKGTGKVKK